MITKKDQDILNFIEEFHIATSKQINSLFYNNVRYCNERLKKLTDNGFIKVTRSTIDNCHAYYADKKPVQIHHDLIRTELYTHIVKRYKVLEWHNEMAVGNIRPDALCYIVDHGVTFPVVVEIHLNNKFDFDKYNFDLKEYLGPFPRVIICTDREVKIPAMAVKFKVVGLDMEGLENIIK
jgi:hypothetical protein